MKIIKFNLNFPSKLENEPYKKKAYSTAKDV